MVTMCLSIRFYFLCLDGDHKSPGDLLHLILSKSLNYSLMSIAGMLMDVSGVI